MTDLTKERYDTAYYADLVERTANYPESYHRKLQDWFDFVGYRFKPGALALDAGCGAGTLAKFLLTRAQRVVGVDAFQYPLDRAQHLVPQAHLCQADLNQPLPFPDQSFDLIAAYEVIEHLRSPEIFVREARRVLRPGGQLVLKTPNAWDLWRVLDPLLGRQWYADMDKTHMRYFSPLSMWWLLRDAGFVEIVVRCGTRPFFRQLRRWNPRLPIVGNGVAARARRAI